MSCLLARALRSPVEIRNQICRKKICRAYASDIVSRSDAEWRNSRRLPQTFRQGEREDDEPLGTQRDAFVHFMPRTPEQKNRIAEWRRKSQEEQESIHTGKFDFSSQSKKAAKLAATSKEINKSRDEDDYNFSIHDSDDLDENQEDPRSYYMNKALNRRLTRRTSKRELARHLEEGVAFGASLEALLRNPREIQYCGQKSRERLLRILLSSKRFAEADNMVKMMMSFGRAPEQAVLDLYLNMNVARTDISPEELLRKVNVIEDLIWHGTGSMSLRSTQTLLEFYGRLGRLDHVDHLIHCLERRNISMNENMYRALLLGLTAGGLYNEALAIANTPTVARFSSCTAVKARILMKLGRTQDAVSLLETASVRIDRALICEQIVDCFCDLKAYTLARHFYKIYERTRIPATPSLIQKIIPLFIANGEYSMAESCAIARLQPAYAVPDKAAAKTCVIFIEECLSQSVNPEVIFSYASKFESLGADKRILWTGAARSFSEYGHNAQKEACINQIFQSGAYRTKRSLLD